MVTEATPVTAEAAACALGRSQIYRLLALAFRYPDGETAGALERLAGLARAQAAGHLSDPVAQGLSDLEARARAAAPERLSDEYVAAFGHVTLPDCPLYETACGLGDPFQQAQILADLAGFYRAFGLEMAAGAAERADHLTVELEFMHYLAYREAFALERHGPEQTALIRDAERRFLELHAGRWVPLVARAVMARAHGVLGAAGRLLERFLADEMARWEVAPLAVAAEGEPLTIPPVADSFRAEEDDGPTESEP